MFYSCILLMNYILVQLGISVIKKYIITSVLIIGCIAPQESRCSATDTIKTTLLASGCVAGAYLVGRSYCSYIYYWTKSRFANELFLANNRLFMTPELFAFELKASILKTHDRLNRSYWSKPEECLRNYPLLACHKDLTKAIDILSVGFWLYPDAEHREQVTELIKLLEIIREAIVADNDFYKERRSLEKSHAHSAPAAVSIDLKLTAR